jgi:hypothetical protein
LSVFFKSKIYFSLAVEACHKADFKSATLVFHQSIIMKFALSEAFTHEAHSEITHPDKL